MSINIPYYSCIICVGQILCPIRAKLCSKTPVCEGGYLTNLFVTFYNLFTLFRTFPHCSLRCHTKANGPTVDRTLPTDLTVSLTLYQTFPLSTLLYQFSHKTHNESMLDQRSLTESDVPILSIVVGRGQPVRYLLRIKDIHTE